MVYTGIWSNIITVDVYCSKCKSVINNYHPNKCVVCANTFCFNCLKRCIICRNDYCKKCSKLYKFKKNVCRTCGPQENKCNIC